MSALRKLPYHQASNSTLLDFNRVLYYSKLDEIYINFLPTDYFVVHNRGKSS